MHLYFLGSPFRNTTKEIFYKGKRNNESIYKWFQKHSPRKYYNKNIKKYINNMTMKKNVLN